jgi:hypothetical protein
MTMTIDDDWLDAFEADMVRLSRRVDAEVGVPMYLVPEDLTASRPTEPAPSALTEEFEAVLAALEARNGPLQTSDIAQVLEVLADRHFLDVPFSSLADGGR